MNIFEKRRALLQEKKIKDEENVDLSKAIDTYRDHMNTSHIHSLNHYNKIKNSKDISDKNEKHLNTLIDYHKNNISNPNVKDTGTDKRYKEHHYHDDEHRTAFNSIQGKKDKPEKKKAVSDKDLVVNTGRNVYRESYLDEALDNSPSTKSWSEWKNHIGNVLDEHEKTHSWELEPNRSKTSSASSRKNSFAGMSRQEGAKTFELAFANHMHNNTGAVDNEEHNKKYRNLSQNSINGLKDKLRNTLGSLDQKNGKPQNSFTEDHIHDMAKAWHADSSKTGEDFAKRYIPYMQEKGYDPKDVKAVHMTGAPSANPSENDFAPIHEIHGKTDKDLKKMGLSAKEYRNIHPSDVLVEHNDGRTRGISLKKSGDILHGGGKGNFYNKLGAEDHGSAKGDGQWDHMIKSFNSASMDQRKDLIQTNTKHHYDPAFPYDHMGPDSLKPYDETHTYKAFNNVLKSENEKGYTPRLIASKSYGRQDQGNGFHVHDEDGNHIVSFNEKFESKLGYESNHIDKISGKQKQDFIKAKELDTPIKPKDHYLENALSDEKPEDMLHQDRSEEDSKHFEAWKNSEHGGSHYKKALSDIQKHIDAKRDFHEHVHDNYDEYYSKEENRADLVDAEKALKGTENDAIKVKNEHDEKFEAWNKNVKTHIQNARNSLYEKPENIFKSINLKHRIDNREHPFDEDFYKKWKASKVGAMHHKNIQNESQAMGKKHVELYGQALRSGKTVETKNFHEDHYKPTSAAKAAVKSYYSNLGVHKNRNSGLRETYNVIQRFFGKK